MSFAFLALAALFTWPAMTAADPPRSDEVARHARHSRGGPWTIELSWDHGIGLWKPSGERWETPIPVGSLDVRVHGGLGLGLMVRVGLLQLALARFELETGPTFRGWLLREGRRGLALGAGAGLSLGLRFDGPRPPLGTAHCVLDDPLGERCRTAYDGRVGAFAMVHLDYREHGFFVGIAGVGRWLPHDLQSQERWTADFAVDAVLRVGGEAEL